MATPSLYRFRFEVSDVDRGVYDSFDFRLALHPSESLAFLLTRAIAYALSVEEGLAFSAEGLCNPDEPALSAPDPRGGLALWIEIGNPSARRLHKATKAARRVQVYTYKNPAPLIEEIRRERVHGSDRLEVYSLDPTFLEQREAQLGRDNRWTLLRSDGALTVGLGEESVTGELGAHQI